MDHKQKIEQMVKEGTVSREQAELLLHAVKESERRRLRWPCFRTYLQVDDTRYYICGLLSKGSRFDEPERLLATGDKVQDTG